MEPQNENSVGPVIGLVIILVLIVLGGLYFWMGRDNAALPETESNTAAADVSAIESQSNSDDISSIEADLNDTDTENLDSELNGA